MLSTFFSPNGTLDPSGFLKAGIALIVLGFILGFARSFAPILGSLGGLLMAALAYPWVIIWIKRLRHGGASPALVLAYLALYVVLLLSLFLVGLLFFSGGDFMTLIGEYSRQEITMEEYQAGIEQNMDPAAALRSMIGAGLLASLITLFIGNMATPNSNQKS